MNIVWYSKGGGGVGNILPCKASLLTFIICHFIADLICVSCRKKGVLKFLSGRHFGIWVSKKRMFLEARIWKHTVRKIMLNVVCILHWAMKLLGHLTVCVMVVQSEHGIEILFFTFCSETVWNSICLWICPPYCADFHSSYISTIFKK